MILFSITKLSLFAPEARFKGGFAVLTFFPPRVVIGLLTFRALYLAWPCFSQVWQDTGTFVSISTVWVPSHFIPVVVVVDVT